MTEFGQAHSLVYEAKRDGVLVPQLCEECGEHVVVAHHDDYAKPLDVRWLCHSHHRKWHARNEPRNRGPVTTISARLDEVDLARLAERAALADRSLSAELRQAVRFYLASPSTERAA